MKALVLSGGGSKGAYQVGAIRHLLGDLGRRYDIICGISVGALNGAMLAMHHTDADPAEAERALRELWYTVDDDRIFKKWFLHPFTALWKSSVYNSQPLRDLVYDEVKIEKLRASGKLFSAGAVSLHTGAYRTWTEGNDDVKEGIIASSAFPGMLTPIEIDGELWTDGGLRNVAPFADAIELGATEIDAVLTYPNGMSGHLEGESILKQLPRIIGSMAEEISHNDLKVAQLYNRLLEHEDLPGKRKIPIRVLQPGGVLIENALDFDPSKIRTNMYRGYVDAKAKNWD